MNEKNTLFLIPVPLADDTQNQVITPQIRDTVAKLDTFFVENIRSARRFISSLRLGLVIDNLTFIELTKSTPEQKTREALTAALTTRNVGVISEAGCPGVADPGAVAVKIAHHFGYKVVPLVGPSSILLALMASGFNGQSFTFHGYLPIDKGERKKAILQLERAASGGRQSQIFMETPFRNESLFESIIESCSPDTMLCIACNLTAPDEFVHSTTIRNWKKTKPELHKRPTIFIFG